MQTHEAPAVGAGLLMFFLLFAGYFMLRPVRETLGIAGGVDNLQWLFTGTFLATLISLPAFGWLASHVPRRLILPWTFAFFTLNLLLFAAALAIAPDDAWVGRAFYVWLSVFNLLTISLAWSVLADVFVTAQAKRLFALMAAGASVGGLSGPILGTVLVGYIDLAGLLVLSALMLAGSAVAGMWLQCWRDRYPTPAHGESRRVPLGGNPFAGATEVFKSPYLSMIAMFVLLLASVSTFLYFEQARVVAETFTDRTHQTQVFGIIDIVVQCLTLIAQLFLTGRIAKRMGVGVLLMTVPLVVAAGILWLALTPVFAVFVVVMVIRRVGEYAFVRPGREMLYTVVSVNDKYKAKNFIDTVVYRGSDALSGWVKRGLDLLAEQPSLAMFIGAALALVWALTGGLLGRLAGQREAQIISGSNSAASARNNAT